MRRSRPEFGQALKRLDAQNVDQAHEANHCEGRDGEADGAFKQHLVPSWEVIAWVGVVQWLNTKV